MSTELFKTIDIFHSHNDAFFSLQTTGSLIPLNILLHTIFVKDVLLTAGLPSLSAIL